MEVKVLGSQAGIHKEDSLKPKRRHDYIQKLMWSHHMP